MAFDSKGLDDYVDVAERIAEFRNKYPDGDLQPIKPEDPWQIVQVQGFEKNGEIAQQTFIAYTAAAYRTPDDPKPGIGCAWEIWPGRTPYTRGSELMNAETSAWGRAIVAALAADTRKGIATRQDVALAQAARGEDGWPVGSEPRPGAATSGPKPAPEAAAAPGRTNGTTLDPKKRGAVFAQLGELGIKEPDAQRAILSEILERPVSSRKGLTNEDADKVVAALRKRPRPAREQVAAS